MKITSVVDSHSLNPEQFGTTTFWERPYYMVDGGKFELYYGDDLTDQVTLIRFGALFVFVPPVVNG